MLLLNVPELLSRKCPTCGSWNPPGIECAICTAVPAPKSTQPETPRKKAGMWSPILSGLLLGAFAFNGSPKPPPPEPTPQNCIETFQVVLVSNEFLPGENEGVGIPEGKIVQRQISTIVSGRAQNTCQRPFDDVHIQLKVTNEEGQSQSGTVLLGKLNPGESKPFGKSWPGKFLTHRVTNIR